MPFIESEGVTGHEEGRPRPPISLDLVLLRHRDCAYTSEEVNRLLDLLCQTFDTEGTEGQFIMCIPYDRIEDLFRQVVVTLDLECVVLPGEQVFTSVMSAFTRREDFGRIGRRLYGTNLYYPRESSTQDGLPLHREVEPKVTMNDIVRSCDADVGRLFVDCATAEKLLELRRFLMAWYLNQVIVDATASMKARDPRAWQFDMLFSVILKSFGFNLMTVWTERVPVSQSSE